MPRKDNKQGGTHPLVLGVPHPELEMANARTDPESDGRKERKNKKKEEARWSM